MNLKFRIREALSCDCISFTVVSAILSVIAYFAPEWMAEITPLFMLQLLSVTTLIALLQYLTFLIPMESQLGLVLTLLAGVALSVLGLGGGVYRWFPWEAKYILLVCAVFVTVFVIVYLVLLWLNKCIAVRINEQLQRRQDDEPHD